MIPETSAAIIEKYFLAFQIVLFLALALAGFLFTRSPKSGFKVREADRKRGPAKGDDLGNAKINKPLELPGINLNGDPHEVLGVKPDASKKEIQDAYRDLLKRFHPDKIGPDGEKITVALTQAREKMLAKPRK